MISISFIHNNVAHDISMFSYKQEDFKNIGCFITEKVDFIIMIRNPWPKRVFVEYAVAI